MQTTSLAWHVDPGELERETVEFLTQLGESPLTEIELRTLRVRCADPESYRRYSHCPQLAAIDVVQHRLKAAELHDLFAPYKPYLEATMTASRATARAVERLAYNTAPVGDFTEKLDAFLAPLVPAAPFVGLLAQGLCAKMFGAPAAPGAEPSADASMRRAEAAGFESREPGRPRVLGCVMCAEPMASGELLCDGCKTAAGVSEVRP